MSYRQAKELVKKYYPKATLLTIEGVNRGAGPRGGDRLTYIYSIYSDRFEIGKDISGGKGFKSIVQAWIAAANLIQPPIGKPEVEVVIKRYHLAEAWLKKAKKRRKKEFEFNKRRSAKASLPVT